ncbi:hypothetical protein OESDEN_14087 [Oesophagostomum dentatum]|uniref:SAP domain-containing protein n=1 Tax=Oesophagostomum dentatum TaxID=61180 RepID=A0A0B1SSM1_OESDE|nr:hypothetical protein OESDEN_14087 [Oesophagostomum dentatum]
MFLTSFVFKNENSFTVDRNSPNFVPPIAQSTPAEPVKKKPKFGSNVKVLKTSGITPMPDYEAMTEDELKHELSKFGLKPMGRKRAIAMLRRIYDEIHPVIDPFTPTVRPLVKKKTAGNTPLAARQAKMKKARGRGKALTTVPETAAMPSPEKTAPIPAATQVAHHEEDGEDGELMRLFY